MFKWLSKKSKDVQPSKQSVLLGEASVPDGQVVYAVGDIHGRADLLQSTLDKIHADEIAADQEKTIIYLGDFIDRGPDSAAVIDILLAQGARGVQQHLIMGNHEEFLIRFLEDPMGGMSWLTYGGAETLLSYGVGMPPGVMSEGKLSKVAEDLNDTLDARGHLAFYRGLKDAINIGGYYFTHAGIDPEVRLDKQTGEYLRWTREPFLSHASGYSHVVVHGHTVTEEPVFKPNRIGIDTGAYHSGKLTCLKLQGNQYSIL